MSRTIRNKGELNLPDGKIESVSKDKKPKKSFVFRGDGWATKARGGIGNKAGWKSWMPKWLFKKYKEKDV